jgi:hypothetical protein
MQTQHQQLLPRRLEESGRNHDKLNHFSLAFDDGIHGTYSNIREDVHLSGDGDSFTGTFSMRFTIYKGTPAR